MFQSLFVYGIRLSSNFIIFHVVIQFYKHFFWRAYLFSFVNSWQLCQRSVVHRCVKLFMVYCFQLVYMSVFMPVTNCFVYCTFIIYYEIRRRYASSIVLCQDLFVYSWWCVVSYEFITIFSIYLKCHCDFYRDCTESVDYFDIFIILSILIHKHRMTLYFWYLL